MQTRHDRFTIRKIVAGVTAMPAPVSHRPVWLCLGYVTMMLYASTVIGPIGLNFVFIDPAVALRQFLATPLVNNGSDQRADWIGNLLMLVPYGFLVAATVWPSGRRWRPAAAMLAVLICAATILTIKYLQLFFPPRTVTLNYIAAQGAGAMIGVAAFATGFRRGVPFSASRQDPIAPLVAVLRIYAVALLIFLLMPLDFALDPDDLRVQAERLPATLLALPGAGRPMEVRAILLLGSAAAFVPVGMLLTFVKIGFHQVRRGPGSVAALGFAITTGIYLLSTLVMGAAPMLVSIPLRTLGILAGAVALRWLVRQDMTRLREKIGRFIPWLIPPYLLALLLVNRLLSLHWLTPHEAIAGAYRLGMLPLFDYYIVSKGAAAKNIVGHALLFLPIGAGLWLRTGTQRAAQAVCWAVLLAIGIETARYLRPGLEGDINAVAVAGLSAALAMRLMPALWSMLDTLARQSAASGFGSGTKRHWDQRGSAVRRSAPAGEIEEY